MYNKDEPFRTFYELLNTRSYTAGVVKSSAAIVFFSAARNSIISSAFLPGPQALKSAVILPRESYVGVLMLRLMALLTGRIA